jgi:hypothetical protein
MRTIKSTRPSRRTVTGGPVHVIASKRETHVALPSSTFFALERIAGM